jgi:hypothetical protein
MIAAAGKETRDGDGAQEAPPSPRAWGPEVFGGGPWFDVAQIAQRTGRAKRIVLLWFEDGCPHRDHKRTSRQVIKQSTMQAVFAYLDGRGLPRWIEGAQAPRCQGAEGKTAAAEGVEVSRCPGAEGSEEELGPLFHARVRAMVEQELELAGSVDFGSLLIKARKAFDECLIKRPHETAMVAEREKWARAIDLASKSLRTLEAAAAEVKEREGRLLERAVAARIVGSLAGIFAAGLTALAADLPRGCLARLAPYLRDGAQEEVARVLSVAARDLTDAERARIAGEITRQMGVMDE